MEKLSRVKKYEELRKSIEMDNNINALNKSTELQNSENLLQSFDSSISHKDFPLQDAKRAKRAKDSNSDEQTSDIPTTDTFTNEYLDDFMKEVRDYNIRKGNRESEDTEVDILYQLNAANRVKRAQYVSEIQEDTAVDQAQESIANEVKNLILDDQEQIQEDVEETKEDILDASTKIRDPKEETVEMITSFMKKPHKEEPIVEEQEEQEERDQSGDTVEVLIPKEIRKTKTVKKEKVQKKPSEAKKQIENMKQSAVKKIKELKIPSHEQVYEETQRMKVQLNECENEISDLSHDVTKNNKLLNCLIIVLTFILFVILGFFAYKIFKVGGY